MKNVIVVICLILGFLSAIWDNRETNFGQWEINISNYGHLGHSLFGAGGFWPRGSGHNYIFGSGLWIGGVLPNGDTVVSVSYDPHSGATEYIPGPPYSALGDPQYHVYFSTDEVFPYPSFSMEDGYAVYNDFDILHHQPDSLHPPEPMGLTVIQKNHVWSKNWADDVHFFSFMIKNDTNYTISNVYVGICMDFDIGDEGGGGNDRCGINLQQKYFYGWQEVWEPGWDSMPGMLGLKLLSPCSLTAFKNFTLNFEPNQDWERYMTLAGYNYLTGAYEPFDTIWPPPDDRRVLMATGPFNIAPNDSFILDWALLAGHDSMPPSPDMQYKSDRTQAYFHAILHTVEVTHPVDGEIISSLYRIGYDAISSTGNPLLVDLYIKSELGFDTIAIDKENTGGYEWITDSFPDCVLGKILALVYDTTTFACDFSDGYFTIDNPGNAPPYLKSLKPRAYEDSTLVDTINKNSPITWFARDPEFQDSLLIDIYFKGQYDLQYFPVALNETNDSFFTWNNLLLRNGLGLLVLQTHDEDFVVAETLPVYLLNQVSGGPVDHVAGINNIVDIDVLIHQPESLTGHTYELEFLQYRMFFDSAYSNYGFPEYIYRITDLNTNAIVIDTYGLRDGYTIDDMAAVKCIKDFSPFINGYSVAALTIGYYTIGSLCFINDSVRIITGIYPEDSISLNHSISTWWAYRGSRLQLDWLLKAGGGLTLLVTDLDYGDTIPYKPYSTMWNLDSAYGWCFRPTSPGGSSSDTLRPGYDRYVFLCGDRIRMWAIGVFPQAGDRWIVYPSEYSPPIKGNVYQFTPINYIAENKTHITAISFQVFPVPFTKTLTIAYALPRSQKIDLAIYDVTGRQVRKLKDKMEKAGAYRLSWNGIDDHGRRVSSGIYFCRFEAESYQETRKFILVK